MLVKRGKPALNKEGECVLRCAVLVTRRLDGKQHLQFPVGLVLDNSLQQARTLLKQRLDNVRIIRLAHTSRRNVTEHGRCQCAHKLSRRLIRSGNVSLDPLEHSGVSPVLIELFKKLLLQINRRGFSRALLKQKGNALVGKRLLQIALAILRNLLRHIDARCCPCCLCRLLALGCLDRLKCRGNDNKRFVRVSEVCEFGNNRGKLQVTVSHGAADKRTDKLIHLRDVNGHVLDKLENHAQTLDVLLRVEHAGIKQRRKQIGRTLAIHLLVLHGIIDHRHNHFLVVLGVVQLLHARNSLLLVRDAKVLLNHIRSFAFALFRRQHLARRKRSSGFGDDGGDGGGTRRRRRLCGPVFGR
eukprot:Opistho-2@32174